MVNITRTLALIAAAAATVIACDCDYGNGQHEVGHNWNGHHGHHGQKGHHGKPGKPGKWWHHGGKGDAPKPPSPPAHHYTPPSGSYKPPAPPAYGKPPGNDKPAPPPKGYEPPKEKPTQTYAPPAETVAPYPGRATKRVTAGVGGLRFDPENIVAAVGDIIEVSFNPLNHSIAQSSFDKPCVPLSDDAIFSGFSFPTREGLAPDVFTFEVKDDKPKWFYCSQTTGSHCQMGMSLVINEPKDGSKTLAQYKEKAATTGESISPPKPGNGGTVAPRAQ